MRQRQTRTSSSDYLNQPGDLGWIVRAHGELYAAEYDWDETFEGLVAQIVGGYAADHDPVREAMWIAESAGRRVGCIGCVAADGTAQLRILLVDPAARGHGLGARLVDTALAFARAFGYERMMLSTTANLVAAGRVYQSRGFRLVGEWTKDQWGARVVEQVYETEL